MAIMGLGFSQSLPFYFQSLFTESESLSVYDQSLDSNLGCPHAEVKVYVGGSVGG